MKRVALTRTTVLRKYSPRRKFGNVARVYQGIEYHSQMEARYAQELDLRKQAIGVDRIKDWTRQVSVKLEVNGMLICRYIVDFVITHSDGHLEWIEVKGYPTPEWKLKEKLFRALYPERKFTIITR